LIDSHPYASFEICTKAVAQLAHASESVRDSFLQLAGGGGYNSHAIYAMKFFTNYLLGAGLPHGRFEGDQLQIKLLDLLFLLTGIPVPSPTSSSDGLPSRHKHPYEMLIERREREREQELAEEKEKKEKEKEKEKGKEKEADEERKDRSLSGVVPSLAQLCTIQIASYFNSLDTDTKSTTTTTDNNNNNNSRHNNDNQSKLNHNHHTTVPLQRYTLLAGTPSHILKPIMLESAVYHLAERLKNDHNALDSMFSYGERVLFAVIEKSLHAARVVMDGLSTFATNNHLTGRFFAVVERLYSERWFQFSLEFALDCLAKFPRDGHLGGGSSTGDYWNYTRTLPCPPIRIIQWILEYFFGYEGEAESGSGGDGGGGGAGSSRGSGSFVGMGAYASRPSGPASPYAGQMQRQMADKKDKMKSLGFILPPGTQRLVVLEKLVNAVPLKADALFYLTKFCLRLQGYSSVPIDLSGKKGEWDADKKMDTGEREGEGSSGSGGTRRHTTMQSISAEEKDAMGVIQFLCVDKLMKVKDDLSLFDLFELGCVYEEMGDFSSALKLLLHCRFDRDRGLGSYRTIFDHGKHITAATVNEKIGQIAELMDKSELAALANFSMTEKVIIDPEVWFSLSSCAFVFFFFVFFVFCFFVVFCILFFRLLFIFCAFILFPCKDINWLL